MCLSKSRFKKGKSLRHPRKCFAITAPGLPSLLQRRAGPRPTLPEASWVRPRGRGNLQRPGRHALPAGEGATVETANRRFGCILGETCKGAKKGVLTRSPHPRPGPAMRSVSLARSASIKRKKDEGGIRRSRRWQAPPLSAARHGRVRRGREVGSSSRGKGGRATHLGLQVQPLPALKPGGGRGEEFDGAAEQIFGTRA